MQKEYILNKFMLIIYIQAGRRSDLMDRVFMDRVSGLSALD